MYTSRQSLELLVAGLDVLHHCLTLLQLLHLDPILLVLVEIGALPHHPVCALEDLLEAAGAGLAVFDEAGAAVVAVEIVAVVNGPVVLHAVGQRVVCAAPDEHPCFEWFGTQQQLVFHRLPGVAVEALEASLAVRRAFNRCQLVAVVEEDLLGEFPAVVEGVLLYRVDGGGVFGDCGEEERRECAGDDFVDVFELRLLVVELLHADLVHLVILNQEDAVSDAVNGAQAERRVVGLQDHLAREVRQYTAHEFGHLREQLLQQREHVSAHSRPSASCQALQLHEAVHVVLLLNRPLQQLFEVLPDAGPVDVAPVGPVVAAALLLDQAELRAVAPAALLGEALVYHLRLHVHQQGLGDCSLVEELREEGLVGGRGPGGLLVHGVEEGLSDLVAALSDLDEGHCHNQQVQWIQLIIPQYH